MGMGIHPVTPVEVFNGVGGIPWQTIDRTTGGILLSTLFPPDTIGFLLHLDVGNVVLGWFGLRTVGSTDELDARFMTGHQWGHIKCDATRSFQFHPRNGPVTYRLQIVAYLTSPVVVMFTNAVERTPALHGAWAVVDVSDICPGAIGVLVEIMGIGFNGGIRPHGSVDPTTEAMEHGFGVLGCDAQQRIDFFTTEFAGDWDRLYIKGYITDGAFFETNPVDITPGVLGVYQDIDIGALIPRSTLAFIARIEGGAWALRTKGSAEDIYQGPSFYPWGMVGLDAAGLLQAKIADFNLRLVGAVAIVLPAVQTLPASVDIATTLWGTLVRDGGEACEVRFQYGATPALGTTTAWRGPYSMGDSFRELIGGLVPNSLYYFRAEARNSAGTATGATLSFTTLRSTSPAVVTLPASGITDYSATLNGILADDASEACQVWFEYGLTASYGMTTLKQGGIVAGNVFSAPVSPLSPGRAFHYRAVAQNSLGIAYGNDATFSTLSSVSSGGGLALELATLLEEA